MRQQELLIYRVENMEDGGLLKDMTHLLEHCGDTVFTEQEREEYKALFYDCAHRLLELAGSHGFSGNLWHCYLTNLLVNCENSYSIACEIRNGTDGSINDAALHDISIFKEFFDADFEPLLQTLDAGDCRILFDYEASRQESRVYNERICKRICSLAKEFINCRNAGEMKVALTAFYQDYGVGKFGLHKSFRVVHKENGVHIEPILKIAHVKLSDLVGYELAKKKLVENTEAFVSGRKSNNCLLFGDAGTGKSSSIKGIINEYYDRGLRIIEVYKHQFQDLNDVISQIKNRNYKFIIYMDDLSFEDFEIEYKYLKAVIEGGLEKKPENVLIYATSNRRHLVREKFSDKEERVDDLHKGDTVSEKLSLVARFGVTIYFGAPDRKLFQEIVLTLAARNHIDLSEEELLAEANKWELNHGGLSGRTAQQFIDYLAGKAGESAW
ncbi:MAG: ATP-binding protein [Lachnospiraceae bacterium]|nr:ATP-binding protein [Lachnospiraceae bacterium]